MTLRIGFVWLTAAILACTAELTDREEEAIRRWVHCDECTSGEREAVRALGDRAVPRLRELLRDGPDDEWSANMEAKFTTVYVAAVDTAPGAAGMAPAAYVQRALANYRANVQKRAATSLKDIGTQESVNALNGAVTGVMRADVTAMIGHTAAAVDPYPGSVEPTDEILIGDTIIVRPAAYEPFTGDERGSLDGAPFVRDTLHLSGNTAGFRFLAARAGLRILTVRNVGNTADSQQTRVLVESSSDANDRLTASCTTDSCRAARAPRYAAATSPIKAVLSLWRAAPPDTLDLITFRPTSPIHVTAAVNWTPAEANVDLRWVECVTWADRGNLDGATPTERPESTTVDILPHECWALLVLLHPQPQTARVTAYLQVTP